MTKIPPPVVDSSKLLFFASTEEGVEFTDRITLLVGSLDEEPERVGEVPYLLIAKPYSNQEELLLMFCDKSWETLGVICFNSLSEAKIKAEKGYTGITAKWQESPYSEKQVREYLRDEYEVDPTAQWWKTTCSFCKESDDLEAAISSTTATICKKCIINFSKEFDEDT